MMGVGRSTDSKDFRGKDAGMYAPVPVDHSLKVHLRKVNCAILENRIRETYLS